MCCAQVLGAACCLLQCCWVTAGGMHAAARSAIYSLALLLVLGRLYCCNSLLRPGCAGIARCVASLQVMLQFAAALLDMLVQAKELYGIEKAACMQLYCLQGSYAGSSALVCLIL